jgi:2-haloacid dehalogenase
VGRDHASEADEPDASPDHAARIDAVVFDLGGVLIDWDPRYVYRELFAGDDEAMETFLGTVATPEWNRLQDAGQTWEQAIGALVAAHPEQRELIEAYHERWPDMLGGPIQGTVDILRELRDAGRVRLLALTNWSAETFPIARERFPFLGWFEGIVVSGEERIAKPDPALYRLLFERFGLDPATTLFIDDVAANIDAAAVLGMPTVRFTDPDTLRTDLVRLGLLPSA